ncbi:SulP family inorganic anion transporter [Paenibacillus hexagrammi]|uniref:SulP family inorganic anion transporter n=1 Tax=Paenibacillus hexagrammi TaxID=2908839 RepID=A0ABY3SE25_9BACL|nr:SulP family inorganic anion transporter [Paenibacillus sp. YPD9-1]UJF32087.1 SulP family inorganic anion transporter [Paenibacillus sp. YPD9-1]
MLNSLKDNWLFNVRADVLAGITATLALIPDSIAFSFIAGVNPMVGIYSSICILLLISFFGGRPGMISAAAGSMSVLMIALVSEHGIQYLFAATILTGIIQLLMGLFKLGKLMNFVPHAVITGFINALAILIFLAQFRNFQGESWPMYLMVAGTLAIIYLFPYLTKAIPSPLVAVVIMMIATLIWDLPLRNVGQVAEIVPSLPSFLIPDIPFTWETLRIILPFSLSLAVVGYSETLLTQAIIDDMTHSKTSRNKEITGQGIANVVTGFFGGMAGCALVAESAINVKLGGRGRLSTLSAAVFLLILIQLFGTYVSLIPMAALVGVMMMVCYEIFDWSYIRQIPKLPKNEVFVMIATVAVVVYTHDLAIGVLVGVLISALIYAYKAASQVEVSQTIQDNEQTIHIKGPLFFVSANELMEQMDIHHDYEKVTLDLTNARVTDHTASLILKRLEEKLRNNGKEVQLLLKAP